MSRLKIKIKLFKLIHKFLNIEFKYIDVKFTNTNRIKVQIPNYHIRLGIDEYSQDDFPNNINSIGLHSKSHVIPYNFILQFINLKRLNLSKNGLSSIPHDLKNLINLERIELSENNLNIIPNIVKKIPNLKQIYLDQNNIKELDNHLSELSLIEILNLRGNQIEYIPKEIENLTELKNLNLSFNQLTEIPANVFYLPKLEILDISSNKITHLPDLQNSSNLLSLSIADNEIDQFPEILLKFNNLNYLDLKGNNISEIDWSIFLKLNINEFDLLNNLFSSEWILKFKAFTRLNHLSSSKIIIDADEIFMYYNIPFQNETLYNIIPEQAQPIIDRLPINEEDSADFYFIGFGITGSLGVLQFYRTNEEYWIVDIPIYSDLGYTSQTYFGRISNNNFEELLIEFFAREKSFQLVKKHDYNTIKEYFYNKWKVSLIFRPMTNY
ncbi:MAG: leucine-rich repeat domain-containing protein [Candidatus Heimdallarchaeota archaeon]|nr:leucine-rich repeat domain-containing protein [Candidatus Heimdallarchaeota archaeon]